MRISGRHKIGKWLVLSFLLINTAFAANTPVSNASEPGSLTDYDQQALYIVKLGLSYVEWPNMTLSDGIKNINICVVGSSPAFVKSLQNFQTAAAKKLKISIAEVDEGQNMAACHIAYVPKNKAGYKDIIARLVHQPILTVSPINSFAASGGMIEMAVSDVDASAGGAPTNSKAHVNLIINNKAAAAANLKIAPELLESASEVIR